MLEKLEEKRNDLIGRSELKIAATLDGGTPSRAEVLKTVSEWLKVREERIALVKIEPIFGSSKSLISLRVYDSPETLKFFEPRYRLARLGLAPKGKGKAKS
ncbi:MAG: hypothetical protein NZ938_06845 [Aigarchaeota archaeon]|nr:hypothetical protein [Candidatus Calditenuaceae archaeon]